MINIMEWNFKFHPVGFGLFTSGKIGGFRFVYDCGTLLDQVYVTNAINSEFKEGDKIDLLAISHFHKDHISGIKYLLSIENIKVETIVLPYFTPKERLNYILTYYKNEIQNEENNWIPTFILDPVGYLLSTFRDKIGKILLIKGNGDISNPKTILGENKNNESSYSLDFSLLENSDDELAIKENEGISDEKVSIKKSGRVYLCRMINIWQFIFYYPDPSPRAIKYFNDILKRAGVGKIETKDDLNKVVKTKGFSKAKKTSKINNKEINNTSLILYHSPICISDISKKNSNLHLHTNNYFQFWPFCAISNESGFLYTGDLDLKSRQAEIDTYYKKLLDQIFVFQVPHHGSIDNWHPFISYKNHGAFHVVSSRLSNTRRKHPNPKMLLSIAANKGIFLWCNESNAIELYGDLRIH